MKKEIYTFDIVSPVQNFVYTMGLKLDNNLFQLLQDLLCKVNCSGVKESSVCGTNGVTYKSR